MAQKRQSQSFKDGRKITSSLLIVIMLILAVFILGGSGAIYATVSSINTATSAAGVTSQVFVDGNDIIVEVIGGNRITHLVSIRLLIEDYKLPELVAVTEVHGPTKLTYQGLAVGLRGTHLIGIRGQFDDGSDMLIFQKELRFT